MHYHYTSIILVSKKRGSMDIKKAKSAQRPSSASHRTLQKSTTLNRKFVKKPTSARVIKTSEHEAMVAARRAAIAAEMNRQHILSIRQKAANPTVTNKAKSSTPDEKPTRHPAQTIAINRIAAQKTAPRQLTARELKDRAIARALAQVDKASDAQTTVIQTQMDGSVKATKFFWKRKKLIFALSLSVISIAFLGFVVWQNLPEIISRVTAASSGIETGTPAYVPRDYYRDSIVSEQSGKITLSYANTKAGHSFTITEEKSSWNSAALLSNYVEPTWGEEYSIAHEQGLTIYIHGSNAAWVNGGIFYLIESPDNNLSITDLHDIAISI